MTRYGLHREIKADQYGVRFLVIHEDEPIKFEIVCEGRIKLERPAEYPWTELPCLSVIDRFAEKLLANADRGMDNAIESRDLIDLAVMRCESIIPLAAIEKAESAYPVMDLLKKVIVRFQQSEMYREKCFDALGIHDQAMVLDGLDLLAKDHGLPVFNRTWKEKGG